MMLSFVETAHVVCPIGATRPGDRTARCQRDRPVAIVVFASRRTQPPTMRRCVNTTLVPFKCQCNTKFMKKLYHVAPKVYGIAYFI
jgi:hypothetical protein